MLKLIKEYKGKLKFMIDIKDTDSIVSFIDKTKANLMDFSRPEDLITLYKLIKKNVPWYRRKDFYAYVTYLLMSGERPSFNTKKQVSQEDRNAKNINRNRPINSVQKAPSSSDDSLTLWVNYSPRTSEIGASFKTFMATTAGVNENEILTLDPKRYCSFVSFANESALNKVLKTLNGKSFEGRTIKVNVKNSDK